MFAGLLPSYNKLSATSGDIWCQNLLALDNGSVSEKDDASVVNDLDRAPLADHDWFADRYRDKSFHAHDGLDPDRWLLIYRISDEKQRDYVEFLLYAMALWSIACGSVIMAVAFSRREENPFAIGPLLLFVGIMTITYATRLRRYGVVRLYARKHEQEHWERWRLSQLDLPPQFRSVQSPVRHYCIIWKDLFHRTRCFTYHSRQISDAVHRKKWLSRALNGNFLVLGRPWALHPEFFDEPPDYIFVRRSM